MGVLRGVVGLIGELLGPRQASRRRRFEVDRNSLVQSSDFKMRARGVERFTALNRKYLSTENTTALTNVVAEKIRLESNPKSRAQLGMEESPSSEDRGGKGQFEGLRILTW